MTLDAASFCDRRPPFRMNVLPSWSTWPLRKKASLYSETS